MSVAAAKRVAKPITTGSEAFKVRCLECHDASKMAKWAKTGYANPQDVLKRMDAKRKGWIHKSETPLILNHIRKVLSAKK